LLTKWSRKKGIVSLDLPPSQGHKYHSHLNTGARAIIPIFCFSGTTNSSPVIFTVTPQCRLHRYVGMINLLHNADLLVRRSFAACEVSEWYVFGFSSSRAWRKDVLFSHAHPSCHAVILSLRSHIAGHSPGPSAPHPRAVFTTIMRNVMCGFAN